MKKRKSAVSLVELMFAMVCFALLLMPVYSLFSQGNFGTWQVRHEVIAQQHAANLLSYLYLFPYDHRNLSECSNKNFTDLELEMGAEKLSLKTEPPYARALTIKEYVNPDWPLKYKIMTINVTWENADRKQRTLQLSGMVFK